MLGGGSAGACTGFLHHAEELRLYPVESCFPGTGASHQVVSGSSRTNHATLSASSCSHEMAASRKLMLGVPGSVSRPAQGSPEVPVPSPSLRRHPPSNVRAQEASPGCTMCGGCREASPRGPRHMGLSCVQASPPRLRALGEITASLVSVDLPSWIPRSTSKASLPCRQLPQALPLPSPPQDEPP